MKEKGRCALVVVLLFIGSFSYMMINETYGVNEKGVGKHIQDDEVLRLELPSNGYTPHDRIEINGDGNFIAQAIYEGWTGAGTKMNPYVISGYNFTGYGNESLIKITYTSVHFSIQDCFFDTGDMAIHLSWLTNATVYNNIVVNSTTSGIAIHHSINCTAEGNTVSDSHIHGFSLYESDNVTVRGNMILRSGFIGIGCGPVRNSTITGNTVLNSDTMGFNIADCQDSVFSFNVVDGAVIGIGLSHSENNTVSYNEVTDCTELGIRFMHCKWIHVISNNASNGIPQGIHSIFSNRLNVTNNIVESNDEGITIRLSSDCVVDNNTVSRNKVYGINILSSSSCQVTSNDVVNNNRSGITVAFSQSVSVRENEISGNELHGIYIQCTNGCLIEDNTIHDNGGYGIYFDQDNCGNHLLENSISNNLGGDINTQAGEILGFSIDYIFVGTIGVIVGAVVVGVIMKRRGM